MANPGNPKPLAAVLLALILTALCVAGDEAKRERREARAVPVGDSFAAEAIATASP